MDKNKNHIKMRLSEQLPTHSADPGTWNRLSDRLDALDAEALYQERLQELPVHSPDSGMWALINGRLNRAAYYRIGIRIALSAAAGLLLFFTVSRISDYYTNSTSAPGFAGQKPSHIQPPVANKANTATAKKSSDKILKQGSTPSVESNQLTDFSFVKQVTYAAKKLNIHNSSPTKPTTGNELTASGLMQSDVPENLTDFSALLDIAIMQELSIQTPDEKTQDYAFENPALKKSSFPIQDFIHTPVAFNTSDLNRELSTTSKPANVKSFDPADTKTDNKSKHFALAMGYLPENINNGTDNTVFHNVDLTASYNKEKVRFNTSVGMAYNEDQFEINMSYDIKSPVTAFGTGGRIDTLSYNSASLRSDYVGTEKHQYLTYNLGIGRRLFGYGRFSTWISLGAGFGLKLNNPNLVASTESSVKKQLNAQITSIHTTQPVYNDINVNFVSGIDFNYKFLNNLSFSFTPTSRWYFKPVLSLNNRPTDELSLGFKTAIKLDF